jgi:iron(III) transport system ATP-binding protein
MSRVLLERIGKSYETFHAVRELDLEIQEGELVTFLGPSGCGKTTTLRMVAGLEIPTSGRILLGDRVVNDPARQIAVPPEHRHIGMVFQSYAVWPHMRISQNIDYPLRIQKVSRDERERRLEEIVNLVQLKGQEDKWPHQLSGGQQQRVALARGLIMKPSVLLLDEPLSNLDAKLRKSMRSEIRDIQQKLRMTMLYVTHDREEAEAISDRMAVMFGGRLAQVGSPDEIRNRPADDEVRAFFSDE